MKLFFILAYFLFKYLLNVSWFLNISFVIHRLKLIGVIIQSIFFHIVLRKRFLNSDLSGKPDLSPIILLTNNIWETGYSLWKCDLDFKFLIAFSDIKNTPSFLNFRISNSYLKSSHACHACQTQLLKEEISIKKLKNLSNRERFQ